MCVLGWISRSHARDGSEIQTSGRHCSAVKIEKLGFLIPVIPKHAWKSWNLAWCHDMAATCCGKFFGRIGTSFGVSFFANRSFPQEGSWFREGTCHLRVRNDIRCPPPWFSLQRQHRTIWVSCKKLRREKAVYVSRFAHRADTFTLETTGLLEGSTGLQEAYTKVVPIRPKKVRSMLLPCQETMPSFMIFRHVLELQELKNQVSQSFWPSHDAQMFEFHSHLLHGT